MLDHVGINVSEYERSRDFYSRALEPLGYSLLMEPAERHGAFVRDPDGNNIEVVYHKPE